MNPIQRRTSGSGRFGYVQKCLKEAGKAYKTRELKDVAEKTLPTEQVCYCLYYSKIYHLRILLLCLGRL